MGHSSEDLPCAEHHGGMAQPPAATRCRCYSFGFFLFVVAFFFRFLPSVHRNPDRGRIKDPCMKLAHVYQQRQLAGTLEAREDGSYCFTYEPDYRGEPVSLTMPVSQRVWEFPHFPSAFEGLLPEGVQLDALLRIRKIDRSDLFSQLLAVGHDVVGSLRIEAP